MLNRANVESFYSGTSLSAGFEKGGKTHVSSKFKYARAPADLQFRACCGVCE